ncbi:MAG: DNA polymerase I [Candidatus Kerfeldbacteria bacterium]|nr:DNA polymerase I [Candidatus Kerfeldbacteria bacterium]
MPPKQRLLIIDGNALIHRSFHALPPLTNAQGEQLNAVYGFATTLLKAWKELKPSHIVATFDLKGPTFRHEEYKEYKATRVKAPDELYAQIPRVKELVATFGIPIYERQGFEADDLIGTITKQAPKTLEKIILTGDMDTMQLVDKTTKVYTLRKGMSDTALYDPAAVHERYGLTPEQVVDYKALRGDPSDNIPGVKGIGEKTATDLLQEFGTLEKLYTALAEDTKKAQALKSGVREKLLAHKSDAFMSQKIATIHREVPVTFDVDAAIVHTYDRQKVVSLLQELNFKSLLTKLPQVNVKASQQSRLSFDISAPTPKKDGHDYTLVNDETTWQTFLTAFKQQSVFAIDTETSDLNLWNAKLLGLSFSWKQGQGWYVVATEERLEALRPILEDPAIAKVGHNLKFDAEILRLNGVTMAPLSFDTMLASYLLNPGTRQHSLDALAFTEFGYEMMPITALIGPKGKKQISMAEVPLDKLAWYSSEDADFTWRLYERLGQKLEQIDDAGLFEKIEMPTVGALINMELTGITVDTEFLAAMSKRIHAKLKRVEEQIYELGGGEFNINSPTQLKTVLFETLKIPIDGLARTKTGISTAADELEKMKDRHPIIGLISEQRELSKLLSTYIDALPELVNPQTGRVHTSYNQAVAATGRLSSSDPNLQNIPIRTELGAAIRKAFVAGRGMRLLSADYSQIELRIIASMAKDTAMMDAFNNGEDIHARTAANINGVPLDQVTPQMRRAAKAVNFGIIYGLGYVGLAQGEGISRAEAKAFIDKYFAIHTHIKQWIDNTKKLAHEKGFVETLFGRRRYFPDINSSNGMLIAAAERQAINAPIQGTAADLMKLAMITVNEKLAAVSPKAKLLLQVHDELVVEAPVDEVERVSKFLKDTMEQVYTLNVPIVVEVGVGKNWGEAKE